MRTLLMSGLWLFLANAFAAASSAPLLSLPYGLTRDGTPLIANVHRSMLDVASPVTRILLVAAPEPDAEAQARTEALLLAVLASAGDADARFPGSTLSVIASPYPTSQHTPSYPPPGRAYDDPTSPESVYLWRWLGMLAPDLVIEVRAANATAWTAPTTGNQPRLFSSLDVRPSPEVDSLVNALALHAPCDVATLPALGLEGNDLQTIDALRTALEQHPVRSPARVVLHQRRERTPVAIARELAGVYGQRFSEVAYIPALPLIGRLRLGELTDDPSHRAAVIQLTADYHAGEVPTLPARSNGSQQAGHLLFGELARATSDQRYEALLRTAADLSFDAEGQARPAMPAHAEMSDAVFMGTPLLAQAARLSGEVRYRDAALSHLRFMTDLNRRADGLHRHSPVAPERTAWGRGNGFVTLGLALTLSEWPTDDPHFGEILSSFRSHLDALRPHQDPLGLWHQVVDEPSSYREYTVTAMITFAIARGLRQGWLDRATYEPIVQRAWPALAQRTAVDGGLVDVCTGTGKMKSLREYLDRPAILGRDERGGGLALLVFTELAFAQNEAVLTLP